MLENSHKNFIKQYLEQQRNVGKLKRQYKQLLNTKLQSRKEIILDSSVQGNIARLKLEKDDIKAQIWVANGVTHLRENRKNLNIIQCHITCQERLTEDIKKLKHETQTLTRQMKSVNRNIYDLNRQTIPDSQHQMHVKKARTKLQLLENQLEVSVRRECNFSTSNGRLKEEIEMLLNHRRIFNSDYGKVIQRLNSDKKYLIDLIAYALNTFENCINVYEKIDNTSKKEARDREQRKVEVQGFTRKFAEDEENQNFIVTKAKRRAMADLEPREYKRRDIFTRKKEKKINLYNNILQKIMEYSQTNSVSKVIEKFQEQESLYYSYFNYANEMDYHMTLLDNSVSRLFANIGELKANNTNTLEQQLHSIANLEKVLARKREINAKVTERNNQKEHQLEVFLQGIEELFRMVQGDATPLMLLLGDHTKISLENVTKFLKILEKRIFEVLTAVYCSQRDEGRKPPGGYVVSQLFKYAEDPSELQDIVLTQQCAECAEGEAVNVDDADIALSTMVDIKNKLHEKVKQPEMQYLLHSISECRLPRSRILASKRNY